MILTAGLGTRLKPLTDTTPKPLVPVGGRPMVSYVLDSLHKYGFNEVLINVHYLAPQLENFAHKHNQTNSQQKIFIQDEQKKILGSGGAIAKARDWLFEHHQSALICNADNLMKPDLLGLQEKHAELVASRKVGVTLSTTSFPKFGGEYTGLRCEQDLVLEFIPAKEVRGQSLSHFPGVYIIEQSAATLLPGAEESFSIVEKLWKPLAAEGRLGAWTYKGPYHDLGSVADLERAESDIRAGLFSEER